ncbi:MAG: dihydrodipicolinate synthase family protein [Chloroflexi bacterium]|nr:dihydrodipicolinate synthase family protein [Chloroflexota bacterium]
MDTLAGVYPPIITPFDDSGTLDAEALAFNVAKWEETGLRGYCVAGSNGEGVLLTDEEICQAVRLVRREASPEKVVIAGTGRESTPATIRLTRAAAEAGAHVALVITPSFYGNEMGPAALLRHYEAVAEASPIPILLYNVPKYTNLNMAPSTVARLASHEKIVGIKDSAGNIGQIIDLLRLCPPDFQVFVGNGPAFLSGLQVGAVGGILAVANVAPREYVSIWELGRAGRWEEARQIHFRLMPVGQAVTTGYGVPGLKAAMDLLGYRGGAPRPPLLPADASARQAIAHILREAGLLG